MKFAILLIFALLIGSAGAIRLNQVTPSDYDMLGYGLTNISNGSAMYDAMTVGQGWDKANRTYFAITEFGADGADNNDDTYAIQATINYSRDHGKLPVYIPPGHFIGANILLQSDVKIFGITGNSFIKLPDGALNASFGGGEIDSYGIYAANVFGCFRKYSGDSWYDGGARAIDYSNKQFIVKNVTIEGISIDGNRENNYIVNGHGQNGDVMAAGINLMAAANCTIRDCEIYNCIMDGVFIGYSLTGGSNFNSIYENDIHNNYRTAIAVITGRHNSIRYNKLSGGKSGAIDIEPNIASEIATETEILHNTIIGSLMMVSPSLANTSYTNIMYNDIKGDVTLNTYIGYSSKFSMNNLIGTLNIAHGNYQPRTQMSYIFGNNIVSNLGGIVGSAANSVASLLIMENTVTSTNGNPVYLIYPKNVIISANHLTSFNASYAPVRLLFGLATSYYWQGNITLENNVINGRGNQYGIEISTGAAPLPELKAALYIRQNICYGSVTTPVGNTGVMNITVADNSWQRSTSAPTSGRHLAGEIYYNMIPTAGGNIGFVCTTGGTPGTWKTFGTIGS